MMKLTPKEVLQKTTLYPYMLLPMLQESPSGELSGWDGPPSWSNCLQRSNDALISITARGRSSTTMVNQVKVQACLCTLVTRWAIRVRSTPSLTVWTGHISGGKWTGVGNYGRWFIALHCAGWRRGYENISTWKRRGRLFESYTIICPIYVVVSMRQDDCWCDILFIVMLGCLPSCVDSIIFWQRLLILDSLSKFGNDNQSHTLASSLTAITMSVSDRQETYTNQRTQNQQSQGTTSLPPYRLWRSTCDGVFTMVTIFLSFCRLSSHLLKEVNVRPPKDSHSLTYLDVVNVALQPPIISCTR